MPALLDGLRVLVLEDEFLIAMDIEQICRDHGASDVTIVDKLDTFDQDAVSRFGAAIIDLTLNGASTLAVAGQLQREGIPFVFASGHPITEETRLAFPGVLLVEKPYSGDDLIAALAQARTAISPQSAGGDIT